MEVENDGKVAMCSPNRRPKARTQSSAESKKNFSTSHKTCKMRDGVVEDKISAENATDFID
jgi:hypothetical protein